ncbi:MAG TPA: aminopeptidase P family protein [Polyangiaceae bacterium]|nr:aminopeptidase P family protein [Polyangiaceae bacterium]
MSRAEDLTPGKPFWPRPSSALAFVERRQRLQALLDGPALLPAGFAPARNFPANRYAFRAESHFLYFVGPPLEGAALLIDPQTAVLYAPRPHPDAALWTGEQRSLEQLAQDCRLEVRPIEELAPGPEVALIPPQGAETALWLADLLDRDVEAGGGDELAGRDAQLADALIRLRLEHDPAAIDQLKQAAVVTELAHRAGMACTRPGLREASVRARMEAAIVESGMTCSYGSIVSVHGEVLHNELHHGVLGENDLLLADVGAETPEGWAGDVTRTWPTSGRFSATQRAIYEVVLAAQHSAIAALAPNVRYLDVHRAAGRRLLQGLIELGILRGDLDDLYARGAAALFFPHGVGHLLGLDVHDMEDLGDRAGYAPGRERSSSPGDRYLRLDRELLPDMLVTIEPGFYQIPRLLSDPAELGDLRDVIDWRVLEQFADVRGIRIEDDVLITRDGSDVLTAAIPKLPDDVEALVRAGHAA